MSLIQRHFNQQQTTNKLNITHKTAFPTLNGRLYHQEATEISPQGNKGGFRGNKGAAGLFIMKRILSLLTAVLAFLAAMAQSPGITLSTQGKMLFFDADKLATAIETAQPNDTIWLGPGEYTLDGLGLADRPGTTLERGKVINKPLNFIGAGGDKTVLTSSYSPYVYIYINDTKAKTSFEGIKINKRLRLLSPIVNLTFKDCWLRSFISSFGDSSIDTLQLDRCRVQRAFNIGSAKVGRLNVRNSYFDCLNDDNDNLNINGTFVGNCKEAVSGASLVNCYIRVMSDRFIGYFLNSFVYDARSANASSTFEYCYFCNKPSSDSDQTGTPLNATLINDNVVERDEYMEAVENPDYALEKGFIGNDGTVVGIYGGNDLKYSLIPAYPTPDTDNSTLVYDKENNKIKVSVKLREE